MPSIESIVVPASQQENYDTIHYSPGVRTGNLLYLSGQTGITAEGVVPEGMTAQATNAFESIGEILKTAGLGFENIVTVTTYHAGDFRTNVWEYMAVKDRYITAPYPAWTAIGVHELAFEGALVEIVVVASFE